MERLKGVLAWFSNPAYVKVLYMIVALIIVGLPFGSPDAGGGP